MVTSDKEFTEKVHLLIHSVRLVSNYKASELEKKLSRLVLDKFKDTCDECKEISEKIKNQPEEKGFFKKLGDLADGS